MWDRADEIPLVDNQLRFFSDEEETHILVSDIEQSEMMCEIVLPLIKIYYEWMI